MGELEEILELQDKATEFLEEARKKIADLQARIKEGEYTTGNKVKDFVISTYGATEFPEREKALRELEEKVAKNQEKQIMVLKQEYSREGEDGCFSQSYLAKSYESRSIGILSGELDFDPKKGEVIIPVEKYANFSYGNSFRWIRGSHKWVLFEEPLKLDFMDLEYLKGENGIKITSLFGKQVEYFFRLPEGKFILPGEQSNDMMNKILEDDYKGYPKKLQRLDTTYVDALELLDLEIPFDFRLKRDQDSLDRKMKLVEELYSEATLDGIKNKLEYALQVGLHIEEFTFSGGEVGVSINCGEYVKGLCEKYKIDLEL